jgi:hypothetical protein
MRTYTDADVRKALRALLNGATYKIASETWGIDAAQLHRMIHGKMPISEKAASAVGFLPCERKWTKA